VAVAHEDGGKQAGRTVPAVDSITEPSANLGENDKMTNTGDNSNMPCGRFWTARGWLCWSVWL